MNQDDYQNYEIIKKRPSLSLKEIIEASNKGVPAPSEEIMKALIA